MTFLRPCHNATLLLLATKEPIELATLLFLAPESAHWISLFIEVLPNLERLCFLDLLLCLIRDRDERQLLICELERTNFGVLFIFPRIDSRVTVVSRSHAGEFLSILDGAAFRDDGTGGQL